MRQTAEIRERLDWMAEHPGEWLWWSSQTYPSSSRHFVAPSFERRIVNHQSVHDGYGPYATWKPGLWIRYVGGRDEEIHAR